MLHLSPLFSKMEEGMVQIQIDDLLLTVDKETADRLSDDVKYRQQYILEVRKQLLFDVSNPEIENPAVQSDYQSCSNNNENTKLPSTLSSQQPIWISAKNQTSHDRAATYFFLNLRKKYADSFNDKITNKNSLWSKIAVEMNSSNFFVGDGIQGREKCRQKFANLQASYIRYIDKRRQTGEGKIIKPPFFDDLDEILGDKHKIEPVLIIDSAKKNDTSNLHTPELSNKISPPSSSPGTSKTTEDTREDISKTQKENKYSSVKNSARPDKNKLLQKFVEVSQENVETNKKNFSDMMGYLREEGKRRHEQIMALITAMN